MSEDRLERALQEMRDEPVDAATLDAARAGVWNRMSSAAGAGCAEFRPDLSAYAGGTLTGSRRLLMEDHLSRCPACRAAMAGLRGESRVIPMPQRSSSRGMRWGALAAAAALPADAGRRNPPLEHAAALDCRKGGCSRKARRARRRIAHRRPERADE